MRKQMRAWMLGVIECRSSFTTHFGGDLIETYDRGRALGRRLLRVVED